MYLYIFIHTYLDMGQHSLLTTPSRNGDTLLVVDGGRSASSVPGQYW